MYCSVQKISFSLEVPPQDRALSQHLLSLTSHCLSCLPKPFHRRPKADMQNLLKQRRTKPSREVDSGLFHQQPQCRLCDQVAWLMNCTEPSHEEHRTQWLCSLFPFCSALFVFFSRFLNAVHSSLFAHSEASLWIPGPTFPKQIINITSHCNGVIFMEAPEEVTWLWLVPRGARGLH